MKEPRKIGRNTPAKGCEIARAIGCSPAMITASKKAGYVFQYGSITTVRHYLAWRSANPDFRITSYVKEHSMPVRERLAKGHSQRRRIDTQMELGRIHRALGDIMEQKGDIEQMIRSTGARCRSSPNWLRTSQRILLSRTSWPAPMRRWPTGSAGRPTPTRNA